MRPNTTILLSGATIVGLLLTGCTGGQSKDEACKIYQEADASLATEMGTATTNAMDDPAGAAKILSTATSAFESDLKRITNDTIRPKADKVVASLKAFNEVLEDTADEIKADPANANSAAMTDAITGIQDAATAVTDTCNG